MLDKEIQAAIEQKNAANDSTIKNTLTLEFGYADGQTKKYELGNVASSVMPSIKNKIKAINASLAGGTDGGLSTFFLSPYDPDTEEGAAVFTGIVSAELISEETTEISVDHSYAFGGAGNVN